jgi:putative peptide zinc metalloprotease protein
MSNPNDKQQAYLTGKLRNDIEIFPGELDSGGAPTWLIFDPVADSYYRLTDEDFRMISALTGNQELDSFVAKLNESGIKADKVKVIKLLNFLNTNNLMLPQYKKTEEKVNKLRDMKKKMFWQILLSSYLFFKLPILKPDRFLSRTLDAVRAIFNRWTFWLLWIIAVSGYVCMVINWHKFADKFIKSISFQGLVRYTLAVVIIKCVHELAHAYTAKRFGVRVRRMGVAFIVFFPRLYTDLTDSWRISDRHKRFLIDGSGIISEIIIGGGAALVWANTAPGLTNTVAYYIFAVSIINTVLINGNPFIRYDGYYMLMDVINIDNLQQRGIERVRSLWRKYLFGIDMPVKDNSKGWKRGFVVFYGISAFIYRLFLYTSIIMIVYFKFTKTLGIVLLMIEVYLLVFKPFYGEVKFLKAFSAKFKRKNLLWSSIGAIIIFCILALPLPWSVALPCEVKPASSDVIYSHISGFLADVAVEDGQTVSKGQRLLSLRNPYIEWRLKESRLDAELDRVRVDQAESDAELLGEVKVNREALRNSMDLIKELERKEQSLVVKSGISGIFVLYDRHLLPGKWLAKGEVIGEVFSAEKRKIIAFVDEEYKDSVKAGDYVKINIADQIRTFTGKVTKVIPVPAILAPSPLLNVFGGSILCYPDQAGNFKPLNPCFQLEVAVKNNELLPAGRTGTVTIRKYSSIGGNIIRNALSVLQRELSF